MKTVSKLATLILIICAVTVSGFGKKAASQNLVRGVVGSVSSVGSWSGYSTLSLIPGAGLIPITATNSVFYLGFTAGTQADISNMVLYTTARGSLTITAVTPIKLGGISNPMINLTSQTVCPVIEISVNNPCIVRLDPVKLTLSALSDYYLVVYFTANDGNNGTLGLTAPSFPQSSLRGTYQFGDDTQLTVGQSIPSNINFNGQPYMLMYVMSN